MAATKNFNQLKINSFKFKIHKFKGLDFFVQDINLPGLTLGTVELPNPFKKIPIAGDTLTYNELSVLFIVNEDMSNYLEIVDWIKGLGFGNNFEEYAAVIKADRVPHTDATLLITTNGSIPQMEIVFKDIVPISIDDISFTVNSPAAIVVSATFNYKSWDHRVIA